MEKIPLFGPLKRAMIKFRQDGWSNIWTGLGTTRDKRTYSTFEAITKLEDEYLDSLYHGDDMAARACDAVPEEMLRRGFEIKAEDLDADIVTDINQLLRDLKTQSKFTDAAVWARVFGGAVIYVGADDGAGKDLTEPLNETAIRTITHLNVINKRYCTPLQWYSDPADPKYGEAEIYQMTPTVSGGAMPITTTHVHESRLITFDGLRASSYFRQLNQGWGLSLLQRMNDILTDFGVSFSSLAHLLQDANQAIFKMKGLFEALSTQNTSIIQQRMQLIDMSRSDLRAVVLDADDEDFARQNFSWSGIKDPYTMLMLRLSAAARVPVTILMGQSPAGMDATGESDLRWFYDTVESHRESYLKPKLEQLIRLITLAKDGPTGGKELENYSIKFPSLWQPTQKEEAEIRKLQSDTDKNYIETGTLLPEEVAISRFTPDGWSQETSIDIEVRQAMLDDEIEKMDEPEPEPPPMPVPPQPVVMQQPEAPPEDEPE